MEHEQQQSAEEQPDELTELEQDFEIEQELGRGESASVFRARDRALGRHVAIKVVRASHDADGRLERTVREARMLAALSHPHIVAIHAVQRLSRGSLALVMQYVEGPTLRELLRERGMLPVELATRILRDIARALLAAHDNGVVHRDVKPENIVIANATGRALLSDFGSAMPLDSAARLAVDDSLVGTPAYMSPEQIDGDELDGRTDVYSLGLVGWEMLSGLHPWGEGPVYEVLLRQREGELPPVDQMRGGVPVPVVNAIEGALEKDRARRWATAADFLTALLAPPDTARREPRPRSNITPAVVPTWAVPSQTAIERPREQQPTAPAPSSSDGPAPARDWMQRPPRPSSAAMSRSAKRRLAAGVFTVTVLLFAILVANGVVNVGTGRDNEVLAAPSPPQAEDQIERPGEIQATPQSEGARVDLSEERQLQADLAAAAAAVSSRELPTAGDTSVLPTAAPLTRSDSLVRCASPMREDQQACLLVWLSQHDVALNRTYRQLIAAMVERDTASTGSEEPEEVQLLRAEQRAWLTERDRECQRRAIPAPDGLWATSRAACLGALGERREQQLRARLEDLIARG